MRGEDSEVVDLVELSRHSTQTIPILRDGTAGAPSLATEDRSDEQLSVEELRDAWPLLDLDERSDGLRVLPREDAEDFFVSLSAVDQASLLLHFRPGQRRQWMRMLEPDDVADLIQRVPEEQRAMLLALLDVPTRKEVTALLAYAEDEAGGLMSTRYARLRPQMTADEAISYLRRQARDKIETIYYAYVLDPEQRLLGVVSFRDLFAADPKRIVAEIMETEVVRVTDEMDQETVSRVFAEKNLTVIPVVDREGRMKGIVTVDDIVDVVQEEATEDIQKFGGMAALEVPYLQSSRRDMIRKRVGWLVLLLIGSMLTATALESFQGQIDDVPLLALFLPMIVSTGGNSGSQASTLVIRAMALGEIRAADWWIILRRELLTGLALGAVLGVIALARVALWGTWGRYGEHFMHMSVVAGLAVVGCVLAGTLAGAMLPFVLRRFGADPASASAPFVATLVDVSGILIYFGIANLVLTGVLL
ncbi:MAG: magnesium transporter [Deltaproteobacteria bacterium]|nr:magnesium transporter [Deltaproteobacteria bacterium]